MLKRSVMVWIKADLKTITKLMKTPFRVRRAKRRVRQEWEICHTGKEEETTKKKKKKGVKQAEPANFLKGKRGAFSPGNGGTTGKKGN